MVRVYPFAALRPAQDYAQKVATRVGPESREELQVKLQNNPHSYLHVVKPGLLYGNAENQQPQYRFAQNYFVQMRENGILSKENSPAIYIYRQTFADGHVFEGLILGISIIDYLEGTIKKHEYTLTEKEAGLVEHVTQTGVVGEPVLIANPEGHIVKDWIRRHKPQLVSLSFNDDDGIKHDVWAIHDKESIAEIQLGFRQTEYLYIADGHHRIAASSLYLNHMHNEKNWSADKMCFMAYIISEEDLWIKPFHRLIAGFGQDELHEIKTALNDRFIITEEKASVVPEKKGVFGMVTQMGWLRLEFKEDAKYSTPAENLDVSRLEKYIFKEILHIQDSKSDSRLGFVRGDMPPSELEVMVKSGICDIAFLLHPNTMDEIKAVADAGQVMPPKSTWIEPKLLAGMLIQEF